MVDKSEGCLLLNPAGMARPAQWAAPPIDGADCEIIRYD